MTAELFALPFALTLVIAFALSRLSIIPGSKETIAVPLGQAPPLESDSDTIAAAPTESAPAANVRDDNEFAEPIAEPDNLRDATPPEPPEDEEDETPVAQGGDATAAADGLIDFEDEFGQSHRVTPHTAAYLKYAQEQIQRSRQQQQFSPTPPQTPPQNLAPAPGPEFIPAPGPGASEAEWSAYFNAIASNNAEMRKQMSELSAMHEQSSLAVHRQGLHDAGMARLDKLLAETPYLKANPRVAAHVRTKIGGQLKSAVSTASRHIDAGAIAAAVYGDAMSLMQECASMVGTRAEANAQARNAAARKSGPPAGGHAPPAAGRKPAPANETPAQLNARMQKFANKVFARS